MSPSPLDPSPEPALRRARQRIRSARRAFLLLDYDGTLVPFTPSPELARPDPALLDLLRGLAARPGFSVHVVSGRARGDLEAWLGDLAGGLHAEHGLWSRLPGEPWRAGPVADLSWKPRARALLDELSARTPGSIIEEKTAGYAWHHRAVESATGEARARELAVRLSALLAGAPVEVLEGNKVVEVRPRGVNKGRVVALVADSAPEPGLFVALGDDRTDEDLFAALPPGSIALHVGPGPSRAGLRLADVAEARSFLSSLA
jgi:trehalose 6-phosphate synthase/phosphatase